MRIKKMINLCERSVGGKKAAVVSGQGRAYHQHTAPSLGRCKRQKLQLECLVPAHTYVTLTQRFKRKRDHSHGAPRYVGGVAERHCVACVQDVEIIAMHKLAETVSHARSIPGRSLPQTFGGCTDLCYEPVLQRGR